MEKNKDGLYWTPYGGSGTDLMWASCHLYASVLNDENGNCAQDSILVDLGQFESPHKIGKGDLKGKYNKIVPDVSDVIDTPDYPTDSPKAKALFLTHGHSDHIEGIYEYAMMGAKLPPVYASEYTFKLLKAGFVSRGLDWKKYIEPHVIKEKDVLHFGKMTVEVASAPHSIPGSLAFKISNEKASVFHSGDIKLEKNSYIRAGADFEHFEQMGKDGLDFAVMDACGAAMQGHAPDEKKVYDTFSALFDENKGKQAVAVVPPGHVERIATVLQAAKDAGRQVVIDGGPIMYTHLMGLEDGELLEKFPNVVMEKDLADRKNSVVLTCGIFASHDNESSPLVAALKAGKKYNKMDDDALVIIAHEAESLKDMFQQNGQYPNARIVSNQDVPGLYAPGHAQLDDLKDIVKMLNPKCVAPMHAPKEIARAFDEAMAADGWDTLSPPEKMYFLSRFRPVEKATLSVTEKSENLKRYLSLLRRSAQNGDTVHIVSGENPQIVHTKSPNAFCFNHTVTTEPLDFPPYEKTTFKKSDTVDRHSYRELGINTENLRLKRTNFASKRAVLEEKKRTYQEEHAAKTQTDSLFVRARLTQNGR